MLRLTTAHQLLVIGIAILPLYADALNGQVDEAARESFLGEARKRREAFERHGAVPKVPESLSKNPDDPEFIFLGYSRLATADEAEDALRHSRAPADLADNDRSVDQDLGVFVNAVGEMWRWKPRDRNLTIAQARAALRLSPTDDESTGSLGAGREDPVDGDWTFKSDKVEVTRREAIIGDNDTRNIRSADAGYCMTCYPWRAIGALEPNGQSTNSPNARCTATKIGPRHLLTAGHCVHTGGAGGSLVLRDWWGGQDGMNFYANGGAAAPNGVRDIQWYWIHSDWLSSSQYNRDYAVLILYDSPSTVGLGWLGYKVDWSLAGTSAWNFGYPVWGNTCENSTWSGNSCRNSMWGMSATITRTTATMAYYKHDTQGGHSGSPIYQYNGGNRQIIAVHKGTYNSIENRGVKITNTVFDNITAVKAAWPSAYY